MPKRTQPSPAKGRARRSKARQAARTPTQKSRKRRTGGAPGTAILAGRRIERDLQEQARQSDADFARELALRGKQVLSLDLFGGLHPAFGLRGIFPAIAPEGEPGSVLVQADLAIGPSGEDPPVETEPVTFAATADGWPSLWQAYAFAVGQARDAWRAAHPGSESPGVWTRTLTLVGAAPVLSEA